MTGLGEWVCKVDTMGIRTDINIKVSNKDSECCCEISAPFFQIPNYYVKNIIEDGNTISGTINVDIFDDKDIPIELIFSENTFKGFIKVPFIGKVELKNGKKIY